MIVGKGVAERSEAGGEIIELAVVAGDDLAQPGCNSIQSTHRPAQLGDLGGEIVELAVMAGHRAGDLRQQLVDSGDIRPVWTTHAITLAVVTRPGQALRVPRSPGLPCDRAC